MLYFSASYENKKMKLLGLKRSTVEEKKSGRKNRKEKKLEMKKAVTYELRHESSGFQTRSQKKARRLKFWI